MIALENVTKRYGNTTVVDDVSLAFGAEGVTALIGPNGAGKSTLFRMITGRDRPDSGEVVIGPTVKIAFVDQSRPRSRRRAP